jgi:hypothetical protein
VTDIQGINIDVGFCHYDERFKENIKDSRFQLYDGKNIPFESNKFDLVTLFSVIHHIPCDEFREVSKEIARVCKGYLYLKDVDLVDEVAKIMFRIQHYVFEGVFLPGNCSYMNWDVTKEITINSLKEAGFKVVHIKDCHNFNNTYYALLQSPANENPIPQFIRGKNDYSNKQKRHYNTEWKNHNYRQNYNPQSTRGYSRYKPRGNDERYGTERSSRRLYHPYNREEHRNNNKKRRTQSPDDDEEKIKRARRAERFGNTNEDREKN